MRRQEAARRGDNQAVWLILYVERDEVVAHYLVLNECQLMSSSPFRPAADLQANRRNRPRFGQSCHWLYSTAMAGMTCLPATGVLFGYGFAEASGNLCGEGVEDQRSFTFGAHQERGTGYQPVEHPPIRNLGENKRVGWGEPANPNTLPLLAQCAMVALVSIAG